MATAPPQSLLKFTGHRHLAHRLTLSTLTGRPMHVSNIRASSHTSPGLSTHETSLLRLLDSLTNGAHIEFSYTGTTFIYKPGLIVGSASAGAYVPGIAARGGVTRHEIPGDNSRGVAYFMLPICLLAPFAKGPVNVLFTGPGCITSATRAGDVSADTVRTAIVPLLAQFGIQINIEVRVIRRSNSGPNGRGGGGEAQLVIGQQVRLPKTLHLLNPGRIKRIRGVAYATGVAGASNARCIEAARGVLNSFVADTYVYSDVGGAPYAVGEGGRGPVSERKKKIGVGFGISLVAESSTGCIFSADVASPPTGGVAAEDIGRQAAYQLLESISRGGCVSDVAAPLMLMFMAMGSEDVGRLQIGKEVLATEEMVHLARDLRTFGCSAWGMRDAKDREGGVVLSVVGRGVGNVGRKIA